jgi:hypothetical protein
MTATAYSSGQKSATLRKEVSTLCGSGGVAASFEMSLAKSPPAATACGTDFLLLRRTLLIMLIISNRYSTE